MKKYLTSILCIAIMLSSFSNVIIYAEEQLADIQPLWIETFDSDAAASKYVSNSKYNASVANGVLTLKATNDSHRATYRLSGDDDVLSEKNKLTFAVTFEPDSLHKQGSIFASFGHGANNAYLAGIQRLSGESYLVYGKAVDGTTKGNLTTTQHNIMTPFSDGTASSNKVAFPDKGVITMIVEVDSNSSTVCSIYVDGAKVGVASETVKNSEYNASTDSAKTMNGHFGLCVPTSQTAIRVGTYAVYDGTGLNHDDIMKQVYSESDFESEDNGSTNIPSTDNTNDNTDTSPDAGATNTPSDTSDKKSDSDTDKPTDSIAEDTQDSQNGNSSSSAIIVALAVVCAIECAVIIGCAVIIFKKKERK